MTKFPIVFILLFLFLSCNPTETTKVLVIPTIHGAHEENPKYTYQDLMQLIKNFNPDALGVEIRPVDIKLNSDSLDLFYPYEMIMVRDSFPHKVSGIDFYSESTRFLQVQQNLFSDTSELGKMKKLVAKLKKDSVLMEKYEKAGIPEILKEQQKMVLNAAPAEFFMGSYDSITRIQYRLEDSLYKGTDFEAYSVFNTRRDLEITNNSLDLVKRNTGKRLVILIGANHRARLMDSLRNRSDVEIIGNFNLLN